jgi:hypothetical protein
VADQLAQEAERARALIDEDEMVIDELRITRPVRLTVDDKQWAKELQRHRRRQENNDSDHDDDENNTGEEEAEEDKDEEPAVAALRRSTRARKSLFSDDLLGLSKNGDSDSNSNSDSDSDSDGKARRRTAKGKEKVDDNKEEEEEEEEEEEIGEVEEILDETPDSTGRTMLYLIKWKGYSADANTWVPYQELVTCLDAFNRYALRRHAKAANTGSSSGHGKRKR